MLSVIVFEVRRVVTHQNQTHAIADGRGKTGQTAKKSVGTSRRTGRRNRCTLTEATVGMAMDAAGSVLSEGVGVDSCWLHPPALADPLHPVRALLGSHGRNDQVGLDSASSRTTVVISTTSGGEPLFARVRGPLLRIQATPLETDLIMVTWDDAYARVENEHSIP